MMITVCRGCTDRKVGCHGTCSKYLAEKDACDKERTAKKKDFKLNYDMIDMKKKRKG